jgi:hypothetical protein
MPERWDNIEILQAIDRLQANAAGAAAWLNGQQLMSEITGTYTVDQSRWAGFVQELLIARDAGLLTFTPPYRVGGSRPAEPSDPNMYVQSISDFALTVAGQDCARGRMLAAEPPDPADPAEERRPTGQQPDARDHRGRHRRAVHTRAGRRLSPRGGAPARHPHTARGRRP